MQMVNNQLLEGSTYTFSLETAQETITYYQLTELLLRTFVKLITFPLATENPLDAFPR